MTNQDANRPQRIKIIIISIIAAILVFIIGAWLITSAIKSVEKISPKQKPVSRQLQRTRIKLPQMRLKITQIPAQTAVQMLLVAQTL